MTWEDQETDNLRSRKRKYAVTQRIKFSRIDKAQDIRNLMSSIY
jgi:hypothetical protein